jgi:hypothetical protein
MTAEEYCQVQTLFREWIEAQRFFISETGGSGKLGGIHAECFTFFQLATARAAFFGFDPPTREECGLYYWDEDIEGPEPEDHA